MFGGRCGLTLQIHLKHEWLILTSSPSFVHGSRYPAAKTERQREKRKASVGGDEALESEALPQSMAVRWVEDLRMKSKIEGNWSINYEEEEASWLKTGRSLEGDKGVKKTPIHDN